MSAGPRYSTRKRIGCSAAALTIVIVWLLGYPATFWLEGRGSISVYDAICIEGTAYWPLQLYRLSSLPGADAIHAVRMGAFDAGLESRAE